MCIHKFVHSSEKWHNFANLAFFVSSKQVSALKATYRAYCHGLLEKSPIKKILFIESVANWNEKITISKRNENDHRLEEENQHFQKEVAQKSSLIHLIGIRSFQNLIA